MAIFNGKKTNDSITGTISADIINGYAGNDSLSGEAGDDVINGGSGNDTLFGDMGNDTLNGGTGNDYLNGGLGKDTLRGDDGNDEIHGYEGSDTLNGGAGNDKLYTGSTGITRGVYTDILNGGAGNDVLYAEGESNSDKAILTGGLGADTFVFSFDYSFNKDYSFSSDGNQSSTVKAPDRITDFNTAQGDLIDTGIDNGQVSVVHLLGYPGVDVLTGEDTIDYYTQSKEIPVVWRGTANVGFTATVGESMTLAGKNIHNNRFFEFWTFYDSVAKKTILFMDRDQNSVVDAKDMRLEFSGNVHLNTTSFIKGTFAVKFGTASADTNINKTLYANNDTIFGLAGNDIY